MGQVTSWRCVGVAKHRRRNHGGSGGIFSHSFASLGALPLYKIISEFQICMLSSTRFLFVQSNVVEVKCYRPKPNLSFLICKAHAIAYELRLC